jgi:hypothetical protein
LFKINFTYTYVEASRLHRFLSKENNSYLGHIKLPSGDYTRSLEEFRGHLLEAHFSGSKGPFSGLCGQPEHEAGYKPREWRREAKVVCASGVEWAVKTFESCKAAGIDRIYPILLQKGLNCLLGLLTKIFRASIALRHVHQVWKAFKVVFIPKPG